MSGNSVIGMAVCENEECQQRIKVHEKHRGLVGKVVSCPKCRRHFVLQLGAALDIDKVQITTEPAEQQSQKGRIRRTRSEMRRIATENVISGFNALLPRLSEMKQSGKASEQDVRLWCCDALEQSFGFTKSDLQLERSVVGQFADILVRNQGRCIYVVECKKLGVKLGKREIDQAVGYAMRLSVPWAVLTNGDIWRLYRIIQSPGRHPELHEVFDVALLDEDGISDADADKLYLLSRRCMTTRDIENEWEKEDASSKPRLIKALFSERVIKAMRRELNDSYKAEFGKNADLDDDLTREEMEDCFIPRELGS